MGEYQTVCREWIWSNGNFAAIPFTMNRSKRDRQDWDYYCDETRRQNLFFNEGFLGVKSDTMTSNKSMALLFVQTAHKRMVEMYEEWRKSIMMFL